MRSSNRTWKLSPSDFAFLWEECKCCFYLKVTGQLDRPFGMMPKIFNTIDKGMKECFSGQRTELIAPGMPEGVIVCGERWVESTVICRPGRACDCYVRGKFDTVARFDDGSYGVIDFKTSDPKSGHVPRYARQLHAYTYALEHAAPGKLALGPVSHLGLLVFGPDSFANHGGGSASLVGGLTWVQVPRDDESFLGFVDEVLAVLEQETPPEPSSSCEWCKYREASRLTGL